MGVGEEAVVEERDRGWTDVGFQLRFEAVGPQVAAPQGQPMRADVSQHRPETDEFVAVVAGFDHGQALAVRSEEHTSELQSLMRISYAVFCLKKKRKLQMIHKSEIQT